MIQLFTTFDLGLASAIVSCGFDLQEIDRTDPRKALFVFPSSPKIDQLNADYCGSRLPVDARTFFNNTKMLKSQLYSSGGSYGL